MAAKLKVFVTSDGLTDYVVAVTSRPKALAAWGSHQDLFKTGLARETDDPALVEAACARPGEVLRRPAGTRATLAKTEITRPKAAKAGPTKAQLRRIAELEARLAALEDRRRADLEDLDARRAALETAYARDRSSAEAALSAAKRARGR